MKRNLILFFVVTIVATVFLITLFSVQSAGAQNTINNNSVSILNLGQGQDLTQDYTLKFEGIDDMESLELRFVPTTTSSNDRLAYAQRQESSTSYWQYQLDISELGAGSYRLETAAILLDGTVVAGEIRNFQVAIEPTAPGEIEVIDPSADKLLAGIYKFKARLSQVVSEFYFKIFDSVGILRAHFAAVRSADSDYQAEYDTTGLDDGKYKVIAEAVLSDSSIASDEVTFYISNRPVDQATSTTVTSTLVSFTHPKRHDTVSGRLLLQVKTNQVVDDVYFRVKTRYINGQEYDNNIWQAYVDTLDFANGPLQIIAVASNDNLTFNSQIFEINVKNETAVKDETTKEPVNVPSVSPGVTSSQQIIENNKSDSTISSDEVEDGNNSSDEEKVVECENVDIDNITCEVYLRNKSNFSPECVAKVIDMESCLAQEDKLMKCDSLGFTDIVLCQRYLTEPRQSRWCNLDEFKYQPVCRGYLNETTSVGTSEADRRVPDSNLDKRCLDQKITDVDKCQRLLDYLNLPEACKRQQITTANACQKWLADNYSDLACQRLGIADKENCHDYLVTTAKSKYVCKVDNCEQLLAEKYVTQLAANIVVDSGMKRRLQELQNKKLEVKGDKQADEVMQEIVDRLPVKYESNQNWRVIAAEDKIRVEKNNLRTVLPAAIIKDSDNDGLPDDMELRLKTDVNNPDSDGDGYLDGEEVANGYDPLVVGGRLVKVLAPIEQALVKGKVLEQALISGEESSDMDVEVESSESDQSVGAAGFGQVVMSGRGPAFNILTLYIYSDLPLVATVQVDEYGRWQYTVKDSLVDGEHQVFVAINDDTGKIVKKSVGTTFFVKEARAATIDEVLNLEVIKDSVSLEKYYLAGAVGLVLIGLVLAIILYRSLNKSNVTE